MPVVVAVQEQAVDCHSLDGAGRRSGVACCCAAAYDCSAGTDLLENLRRIDVADHLVGLGIVGGHFA